MLPRILLAIVLLGACSPEPSAPGGNRREIAVVSGGEIVDTIAARPEEPIVVQVRGPNSRGALVTFTAPWVPTLQGDGVTPLTAFSASGDTWEMSEIELLADDEGRVSVYLHLGGVAATAWVRIEAPALDLVDSVRVTVRPGRPARVVFGVPDTTLSVGDSFTLTAVARDLAGNDSPDPVAFTSSLPAVATIGEDRVVRGVETGRAFIVGEAAGRRDSIGVSVVPGGVLLGVSRSQDSGDLQQVHVQDVNGTGRRSVPTLTFGFNHLAPAFLPDGSRVVVHGSRAGPPGQVIPLHLYLLDPATLAVTPLRDAAGAHIEGSFPHPSRDGQWVYYRSERGYALSEIWRVHPDGTGAERVGPEAEFGDMATMPTVSPDGSRIAWVGERAQLSLPDVLRVKDLATGEVREVATAASRPRWSPVGDEIAMYRQGRLVVVRPDGTQVASFAPSGPGEPEVQFDAREGGVEWSPDGRWLLACTTGRFSGNRSLVIFERATGVRIPLPYSVPLNLCEAAWR